jgi:hypothetical protein
MAGGWCVSQGLGTTINFLSSAARCSGDRPGSGRVLGVGQRPQQELVPETGVPGPLAAPTVLVGGPIDPIAGSLRSPTLLTEQRVPPHRTARRGGHGTVTAGAEMRRGVPGRGAPPTVPFILTGPRSTRSRDRRRRPARRSGRGPVRTHAASGRPLGRRGAQLAAVVYAPDRTSAWVELGGSGSTRKVKDSSVARGGSPVA